MFCLGLNGLECMGSVESEAVAEVGDVGVGERSNSLMSSGSWEWRVWELGSECGSNRRVGNEAGGGMELRG